MILTWSSCDTDQHRSSCDTDQDRSSYDTDQDDKNQFLFKLSCDTYQFVFKLSCDKDQFLLKQYNIESLQAGEGACDSFYGCF